MNLLKLKITTFLVAIALAPAVMAQNALISEDAALKNFKEAAKHYRKDDVNTNEPSLENGSEEPNGKASETTITVIDQEELDRYEREVGTEFAPIENIDVSVNIENRTLEEVVSSIIEESKTQAGEWTVKWRVSPENSYIKSERVNLTAETNLSNFMSYLVDRVNNMTGIQLFVTVFDKSHIIVISDTYY